MKNEVVGPIKEALKALTEGFSEGVSTTGADVFFGKVLDILNSEEGFKEKMKALDQALEQHPDFDPIYHYLFDLLMLSFIASDSARMAEDYLESEEWIAIEDETADRGSELLNLFVYLSEAHDQGVKVDFHDFIDEFLLADDDLYQDDFFIYEPVIRNEGLTEAPVEEIIEVGKKIDSPELQEVFVPIMSFFSTVGSRKEKQAALAKEPWQKGIHLALYGAVCAYYQGLKDMDVHEQ